MSTITTQCSIERWRIAESLAAIALLGLSGCGPGDSPASSAEGPTQVLQSGLGQTVEPAGVCYAVGAGDGWVDTFMPQSTGTFSVRLWGEPSQVFLDTVVGLSNGPADSFTDLGPIVRFAPNGIIDARDGDHYTGGFPYRPSDGGFVLEMDVSIPTHTYDVWIQHRDSPSKPFDLLAQNLAFRSEQSQVTRLDNVGRFTDSAQGSLYTCDFQYTAPDACQSAQAGSWLSQGFPTQAGHIRLQFEASTDSTSTDAVIGASQGAPNAFTSLAAIVRFRPDGTFDARNGSNYSADATVAYVAGKRYQFGLDIDLPHGTYSATVRDWGVAIYDNPGIVFAQNYAFRTEQAQVQSLDHLGQFVDGTPGTLSACDLTVAY